MSSFGPSSAGPPSLPAGPVRVAVVDDDPTARRLMRYWLENAGYAVVEVASAQEAKILQTQKPDIACVDLGLGDGSGVDIIKMLHALDPRLPAVVVTAQRDVETAVVAMRAGAYDYVTKPLDSERLLHAMARARDRHQLVLSSERVENQTRKLRGVLSGRSRAMREVERQVSRVIDRDVAVILIGEHGVGKELIARTIHSASPRESGPLIVMDCGALEAVDHETLLFGRETREAVVSRGLYEQASGGVLYIDNIQLLAPQAQLGLTLALSGRPLRRVDGRSEILANVRVIVGAPNDLRQEVELGHFREELFFRLVVFPIHVPPLRERREDIPAIVTYFLTEHAVRIGGEVANQITPEALEALAAHSWPGNLRQLENVVQRGMLTASGGIVQLGDLPAEVRGVPANDVKAESSGSPFSDNDIVPLRELERRAIEHALRVTNGSVSLAAKRLGIGRATLYRRIASLELSLDVA